MRFFYFFIFIFIIPLVSSVNTVSSFNISEYPPEIVGFSNMGEKLVIEITDKNGQDLTFGLDSGGNIILPEKVEVVDLNIKIIYNKDSINFNDVYFWVSDGNVNITQNIKQNNLITGYVTANTNSNFLQRIFEFIKKWLI